MRLKCHRVIFLYEGSKKNVGRFPPIYRLIFFLLFDMGWMVPGVHHPGCLSLSNRCALSDLLHSCGCQAVMSTFLNIKTEYNMLHLSQCVFV